MFLVTLLASAALFANASSGAAVAPSSTPLTLAIQRAEQFWGGPPCGGEFSVMIDDVPASIGYTVGCSIHLQRTDFGTIEDQVAYWPQFCRALTHEMGHARLGPDFFAAWNPSDPGHSPSSGSVMYFTDPAYPSTCFPARFTTSTGIYHYVLHGLLHGHLIQWTQRIGGRPVGRGLIRHAIQHPWYRY